MVREWKQARGALFKMPSKLSCGKGSFVLCGPRKENPGWVRIQQSGNHQEGGRIKLTVRNPFLIGREECFYCVSGILLSTLHKLSHLATNRLARFGYVQ